MRIVFTFLALCFLCAWIGNENTTNMHEHLTALPSDHYRYCELRTGATDSDDSQACQCGTVTPPLTLLGQAASTSDGHLLSDRWTRTAVDGFGINAGDSITLTWGFVQDGTNVSFQGTFEGSSLIASLDNNFSESNTSADLTQRSWFQIFEGTFERYEAISGLNFVYEPNDNGTTLNGGGRGIVGTVPDIRIGGRSIDGQTGSNTLAFNFFPNSGDMVIDTDNTNFFAANSTGFRNVVAHEFGHGLGMPHVLSNSDRFLLEPFIAFSFDGPQHTDVLALHRGYGDHFENGVGNDTVANATPLGDLVDFAGIGMDGSRQLVRMTDEDFVSIDGITDTDVFSFDVTQTGAFSITLTPMGYQYDLAEQAPDGDADESTRVIVDSSELNDLGFALLDQNGTSVLGVADDNGLGVADSLEVSLTPGTYFIEVTGSVDRTQLYSLTSSVEVLQTQIVVSTSTTAPTTDLLASQTAGGSELFGGVASDPFQGQSFSLAVDFTLEAITVQVDGDASGGEGTAEDASALSLNVYQLPLDPVTGAPVPTFNSTTLLGSFNDPTAESFDANSSSTNPLYLTFDLDPTGTSELGTLSANAFYAFTITSNSTTNPNFRIVHSLIDQFADGNGIFADANGGLELRDGNDAVFFLQGTGSFAIGDVNCDGLIDFSDINPFIAVFVSGEFSDKADIDRNGIVDFLDIPPFILLLAGN